MIKLSTPNIEGAAIEAMVEVVKSGQLVHGEECLKFESELCEYLGIEHALVVSNGTAALHLALLALDIGHGDAVLVPDFTYPATGNVVSVSGAKVVPVDVDSETYCIDVDSLERIVTSWQGPENLRAIMPVHEFGYPADMERINQIAKRHQLSVVEDAACAIGATINGKKMGTFGDIGCFSFHPRKTLTTGEGGLVVTNNDELADRIRRFRNHGMERTERGMKFFFPGLNYRLTNFQAALGRQQLPSLDAWISKRKDLAKSYRNALQPIADAGKIRLPADNLGHSWQTFMIVLADKYDRDLLTKDLRDLGIETSLGAQSLTTLDIYPGVDVNGVSKLVGHELFKQGLALPFCEKYDDTIVEKVVSALSGLLK